MDDFLKQMGRAVEGLAGEAGRQAEILKFQARIGSLDDDLDRVFIEAGKRARELLTMRQIHDDELRVILERAKTIEAEMMEVRGQIQDLRQGQPKAEAPVAEAPVAEAPDAEKPDAGAPGAKCSECGTAVPEDSTFCPNCGVRLG